jgi:hypothetical protein
MRILGLVSLFLFSAAACSSAGQPSSVVEGLAADTAAGSPFFYLRCNSTDWGVDEVSRLLPTADPNVFTRTITVENVGGDPCSLAAVTAPGPDQWGTAQTFFSTPNSATLDAPGSTTLVAQTQGQGQFTVQYPQTGVYLATYNVAQNLLSISGPQAGTQGGGEFFYMRCNNTSWNVDENSRLFPTQNPHVFSRTVSVNSAGPVPCALTGAVANAADQWGIAQTYFTVPNSGTFTVPGSSAVAARLQQSPFSVQYPAAGTFVVTYDASQNTLSIVPPVFNLSSPTDIVAPGNYTLTADIDTFFNPNANSVEPISIHDTQAVNLNCAGHKLTANSGNAGIFALDIRNVKNVTVTNCIVANRGFPFGVSLNIDGSSNVSVTQSQVHAVSGSNSTGLTIEGNTIGGFYAQNNTSGSVIQGNTVVADPIVTTAGLIISANGSNNLIASNSLNGRWDGQGLDNVGADDGIILVSETGDRVASNTIDLVFDCGIETVNLIQDTVFTDNIVQGAGNCCVGEFRALSWLNNQVLNTQCSGTANMFVFTRDFPLQPNESTVFFANNTFKNNVQTNQQPDPSVVAFSLFNLASIGIPPAQLDIANNVFTGNTFVGPTPEFLPDSIATDGGGNICAKGTDPTFPLACGRP